MIILDGTVYTDLNNTPFDGLNAFFQDANSLEEIVRVEAGKIIFFEAHYFRMMASMRILRMGIPMTYTMEYFEKQVSLLLEKSNLQHTSAQVYFSFYSITKPIRSNSIPSTSFVLRAEASQSLTVVHKMSRSIELYKDHWLVGGLFGTLEPSNARLRKLASVFAYENDYEDCVLLNHNKQITETTNGAIFIVKENQVKTPPLTSGCRSSVYRQIIIDLLVKNKDFELIEDVVSPFELQKADELFIVSLTHGIQSVKQYRKKIFTSNTAESLFTNFMTNYRLS